MAVESVNNKQNSHYAIIGGGAGLALGAAAGGTMGYLSKPWMKDGNITDTFVRNFDEKRVKENKDFYKKLFNEIKKVSETGSLEGVSETAKETINEYISVETASKDDLKNILKTITEKEGVESFEQILASRNELVDNYSLKSVIERARKWKEINIPITASVDELKQFLSKHKDIINCAYEVTEENVDFIIVDLKLRQLSETISVVHEAYQNTAETLMEHIDLEKGSLKKLAANADENTKTIFKLIKKTIKEMNTKAALKYGAIAAGVLGVVGAVTGFMQSKKTNA